jgi:serine/threonine protein kinase
MLTCEPCQYRDCFIRSYGWFENSSAIFITMEYMQLGDLEKYLRKPFPEVQVCNVLQQLLEGLQFMHDNQFAHRDLKPSVRFLLLATTVSI